MWAPFFDPEIDGLCKLIACILFELVSAIGCLLSSLTLAMGQQLSNLVLPWTYRLAIVASSFSTTFWLVVYFSFGLQMSTMSPALGWFFVTVAWFAGVVNVDSVGFTVRDQEDGVRIFLTEAWLAWSVLVLLDVVTLAKTRMLAQLLEQLLLRQFNKTFDVEISLPDSLIRCYMPTDPGSPCDQHFRSLMSELHKPELWHVPEYMKKSQNGRKWKLPSFFLDPYSRAARQKLRTPARNTTQTRPLDSDDDLEQTEYSPEALARLFRKNVFRRYTEDEDRATEPANKKETDTGAIVSNAQNPEDSDESVDGEDDGPESTDAQEELNKDESGHQQQPVSSPTTAPLEPTDSGESGDLEPESLCEFESGGPTNAPFATDDGMDSEESRLFGMLHSQDFVDIARESAIEDLLTFGPDPTEEPEGLREFDGEGKEPAEGPEDLREPEAEGQEIANFGAATQQTVSLELTGEGLPLLDVAAEPEATSVVEGRAAWLGHVGDPLQEGSRESLSPEPHPSTLVFESSMEQEFTGVPMELELSGLALVPENSSEWDGDLNMPDSPAEVDDQVASLEAAFRGLSLYEAPADDDQMVDAVDVATGPGAALGTLMDKTAALLPYHLTSFSADDQMTDALIQGPAPTLDTAQTDARVASGFVTDTPMALFADDLAHNTTATDVSLATAASPTPAFMTDLGASSSLDEFLNASGGSYPTESVAVDAGLSTACTPAPAQGEASSTPVAAVQPSIPKTGHFLTAHEDYHEFDDENDFLKDMQSALALMPEPTEPEPETEAPLFAFPPEGLPLFSPADVPQPEAPAHNTEPLPINFNINFSLSYEGTRDQKKVPKMDDAETIATRSKLIPRSRRVTKEASTEKQPIADETTKVTAKDEMEAEPG